MSGTRNLSQHLNIFREKTRLKPITFEDGHTWSYYRAGYEHAETVLLLPSLGGMAEAQFRYIDGLASAFQVVAPNLPTTLQTAEEAILGIRTLLANEGIERVNVVGLSFGGLLAQIFMRRFSHMIDDLILGFATVPNENDALRIGMQRNFMRYYPSPLLMAVNKRGLVRGIAESTPTAPDEVRDFWKGYFNSHYGNAYKRADMLTRARLSIDIHSHHQYGQRETFHIKGEMLIIEATHDEVVGEGERGALTMMFPNAYLQTLEGHSHLSLLLHGDDLVQSITRFLLRHEEGTNS